MEALHSALQTLLVVNMGEGRRGEGCTVALASSLRVVGTCPSLTAGDENTAFDIQ